VPQTGEKKIVKGRIQWAITDSSMDHTKTDARTIEFRTAIEPGSQAIITYTVHYTW
jgi:hypothetical protein